MARLKFNALWMALVIAASVPSESVAKDIIKDSDGDFAVDITNYCSSVKSNKSDIGIRIIGISIADSVCSIVNTIANRGLRCKMPLVPRSRLTERGKNVWNYGINCGEGDSSLRVSIDSEFFEHLEGDFYQLLYRDFYRSARKRIIGTAEGAQEFWNRAAPHLIEFKPEKITIKCGVFNACTVTGRDLAQAIVNNVSGVRSMDMELIEGYTSYYDYWAATGPTEFGEVITVSPVDELGPKLEIERGNIDAYSRGGIKLD